MDRPHDPGRADLERRLGELNDQLDRQRRALASCGMRAADVELCLEPGLTYAIGLQARLSRDWDRGRDQER